MRKYFLFLLLSLGVALPAYGQGYDCRILFSINTDSSTNTATFDNRSNGCNFWTLVYQADGLSALTLTFQSADGAATPGSFGAFSGTVTSGINPNTSTTGAQTTFTGFASWLRINSTGTASGSPLVNGVAYGFHSGFAPISSGGCAGTVATPCVVDGPVAAGAAPTKPPVLIGGQDGAPGNTRTLQTDSSGRPIVVGAAIDGAAVAGAPVRVAGKDGSGNTQDVITDTAGRLDPAGLASAQADGRSNTPTVPVAGGLESTQPVYPYKFNNSTWDKDFVCTGNAAITLAAGTDVVIVAGVASTNTRLCGLYFSGATVADFTIRQGTGSTCGTNTAALTGAFANATAAALDLKSDGAVLITTVQARDLCLHFSTSVTIGGFATYAQF